jgi:hypothetical protein
VAAIRSKSIKRKIPEETQEIIGIFVSTLLAQIDFLNLHIEILIKQACLAN